MRAGYVPTEEIGPVIGELVKERWPHTYGYDVLAEKVGCDPAAIWAIVAREGKREAQFDLVDKIMCALGRYDMWFGRFRHIYYAVEFRETCASPLCGKQFRERVLGGACDGRRKFCSKKCQRLEEGMRRGIATGHRKNNCCNKGHKFTDENIIWSGGYRRCRICTHERHAERMQNPEYRERMRVRSQQARDRKKVAA